MPLPRGTRYFIIAFFSYEVLYLLGTFSTRYFFLLDESHRAISLGLVVILTLLLVPARKKDDGVRWYDFILMAIGALGCFYVAPTSRIVELQLASPEAEPHQLVLGVVTLLVLLEGTRRVAGVVLPALLVLSLIYAHFANYFPGFLYGRGHTFARVIGEVYLSVNGVFGDVMGLWTRVLVVFVLFGAFLHVSGAGKFFIDLALAATGHLRGGPAKVAVIASGLFGTVSGSAAADVATTGVVTIPMMKSAGYRPAFAGAVEAVASTGGVLMPPMMGMVAFMIAEFLDIPYLEVCVAAAIPAALYYASLYVLVDLEARRSGLEGLPRGELPSLATTLRNGWPYLVPIAVLVFYLAVMRAPPGIAALYALAVLWLVTFPQAATRLTGRRLVAGFEQAARTALIVAIVCGAVGMLITSVTITGAALRGAVLLTQAAGGHLIFLLALAGLASLVLGTGVPAIASYVLLATAVAPAVVALGVPPIGAHLFVLYWGVSHVITPPVGGALYIASSFSGVDIWRQGLEALKLGSALFVIPFIFCFHPELLLQGSPGEVVFRTLAALAAMVLVGASLVGFLRRRLALWERALLAASGLCLIAGTPLTLALGLALAAAAFAAIATLRAPPETRGTGPTRSPTV